MLFIVENQRTNRWSVEQTERHCCVDTMSQPGHGIIAATMANPAIPL